ncbi:hypothetical protein ABWI13_28605 [Streptomyces koyangensis]|uniref:hypothetical protein n=1 Tax=Streptomyces koyangensis TaxID=188770 RepID=UPI00336FABC1
MDFPPLFLLGRALSAAHLGNSDMRSFGTAQVVARFDRTALAAYVRAPVETSPEVLLELLGVEPVAVVRVMAWDRGGVPWVGCALRSDAAEVLARRVLGALTDEQAAALRLGDAIDALAPVGGPEEADVSAASYGPGAVTVDIPPGCMHFLPHIVAATGPDRVEISRHPRGGLHVELTVDQADRLTTTLLSAAAPSAEPGEQGAAS